jgi:hypothetical protein
VCGSSSRLVQLTVLPAGTVSVAGAKAKLSMKTALPAAGAAEPADGVAGPAGIPGIGGMPPPGIPGVVAAGPNVTDGAFTDGGDEHPATVNAKIKMLAPHGRPRISHLHHRP